ncbi:hypothetical protein J6590_098222 [Homalodisca vitripennis]|nr:hypothetical protein J6590_098222 [Homalodisca vitripennis]
MKRPLLCFRSDGIFWMGNVSLVFSEEGETSSEPAFLIKAGKGWRALMSRGTPPTPTIISRSRLFLLNYPYTPKSKNFRFVMCRSWTSSRLPSVGSTGRYKPDRSGPSRLGLLTLPCLSILEVVLYCRVKCKSGNSHSMGLKLAATVIRCSDIEVPQLDTFLL